MKKPIKLGPFFVLHKSSLIEGPQYFLSILTWIVSFKLLFTHMPTFIWSLGYQFVFALYIIVAAPSTEFNTKKIVIIVINVFLLTLFINLYIITGINMKIPNIIKKVVMLYPCSIDVLLKRINSIIYLVIPIGVKDVLFTANN